MHVITVLLATILSIFSTSVMSYLALVTPIGPWIAPTLVIIGFILLWPCARWVAHVEKTVAYAVCAGSVGGILGTAFGFYFPTVYFVDPLLFTAWLDRPLFFWSMLASLAMTSGLFALWCTDLLEDRLIVRKQLPFLVAQLTHRALNVHHSVQQAWQLVSGFCATIIFCGAQQGLRIIPASLVLNYPISLGLITIPTITLKLWPLLWAIGFVAGTSIIMPVAVGAISQVVILDPLNHLFFKTLSTIDFYLAFCSGIVLIGAVQSFLQVGKHAITGAYKTLSGRVRCERIVWHSFFVSSFFRVFLLAAIALFLLLTYCKVSIIGQWYVLVATFISVWQIAEIAGKTGLATMGRYATLVMVPGSLLFSMSSVQAALVATVVGAAGGIAADMLAGRKLAQLIALEHKTVWRYQVFGLLVSACTVGIVFWILIVHFGLGSAHLFAQRAQARQLILQVAQFDYYALALGAIYGMILHKCSFNSLLVFTGILMPLSDSLGLIIGGLMALLAISSDRWYPLWSGVFVANSLWMIMRAFF